MTGSLAVLGGTAYLYTITKSLDISFLLKFKYSNDEKTVLFFLFFFGFGVKIPI
jgi:NADH:ubiquinone oxidoreductase subunit 4 (subunit M)